MKSAHVHLLSAALAELKGIGAGSSRSHPPIRVLDIGCGHGQLMIDLAEHWSRSAASLPELEIYGFEVYDHRAGIPGFAESLVDRLSRAVREVAWDDRLRFVAAGDPWPFEEGFFDLAISNQVLEHVKDLGAFFAQERRVLRQGGSSVHFYPSKESLVEPHCGVPWAHRVDRDGLLRWLRSWSRLRIGKFPHYRRSRGSTLQGFCEEFFDYLGRYVFFRPNSEIRSLALEGARLAGFGYQWDLLGRGLRDEWELFPYSYCEGLSRRSLFAALSSSTLVRRF
jgi:SAM-dependent methyltransferase